MPVKRYKYLFQLCKLYRPKTICEIGTNKGRRGVIMLALSAEGNPNSKITYKGYDLFDLITPELSKAEGNGKTIDLGMKKVDQLFSKKLKKKRNLNCEWTFVRGDTNEVLDYQVFDFVFIDGGHKIETIRNDYDKLKDSEVIVFDDFYSGSEGEDCALRVKQGLGCNDLIHELEQDSELHVEYFPKLGTLHANKNLHLVLVVRKKDYKEL